MNPSHRLHFRIWMAALCGILAVSALAFGIFEYGEDLLYYRRRSNWLVALPAIVLFLSASLAFGRKWIFFASMPLLAYAAVETGLGFIANEKRSHRYVYVAGERYRTSKSIAPDGPIPGAWATIRRVVNGETEFEVTYSFDSHGRRETPVPESANPTRAALFFGGSYLYGSGVENSETLPAAFTRLDPSYRSYNYGFHRYGPSQALDSLKSRNLREEISEEPDLAIYVMTDADISRVIGSMSVARYCKRCSNYDLDDTGDLVRRGDFTTGRPLRTVLYNVFVKSNIVRVFAIDHPWILTDEHRRRTSAVIGSLRDRLEAAFPELSFFVLILPGNQKCRSVIPFLKSSGIDVLDYFQLYDADDPRYHISASDPHPSPLAFERVANALSLELESRPRVD